MADAPKSGTLRIAPDLNATLAKAAKGAGVSATKLADQLLREGLGMAEPKGKPASSGRAESLTGAGTRRTTKDAGAGCRHPVNRRIGTSCAECGATNVKAT